MTTSRTARVLATLLACMRFSVVAVLATVAFMVVRGQPVHADAVPLLRRVESLALFTADQPGATPYTLRGDLQSLLAHHSTLAVRFMRATVDGDPDLVDAADAVLAGSSNDLEATLEPAIGGEAAAAFSRRWQLRSRMLFRYAAGVRDGDTAVREEARHQLASYDQVVASVLSRATDGRVAQERLRAALQRQTDQLIDQIERYAAGSHTDAYGLQRDIYTRAYPIGGIIAAAADPSTPQVTPAEQLRTSLSRLLGEHTELTIDAMRAGVTGAEDFDAAAGALDANTADVTGAMRSLVTDEQAAQFADVWADQIDRFVGYTVAVAESNEQARADERVALGEIADRIGAVLAETTDGAIDATQASDAMGRHHRHVLDQIELYADDSYEEAHDAAYAAYLHVDSVADGFAAGLADVVSARLPEGGAATGGGGDTGWLIDP